MQYVLNGTRIVLSFASFIGIYVLFWDIVELPLAIATLAATAVLQANLEFLQMKLNRAAGKEYKRLLFPAVALMVAGLACAGLALWIWWYPLPPLDGGPKCGATCLAILAPVHSPGSLVFR